MKKINKQILFVFGGLIAVGIIWQMGSYTSTLRAASGTEVKLLDRGQLEVDVQRSPQENIEGRMQYDYYRLRSPRSGKIPEGIRSRELNHAKSLPVSDRLNAANFRGPAITFNFTPRGPRNVGGRTRAVALDLSDGTEQTILAGGVSGGMWKSINGGSTWVRTTTPDQFQSVVCLLQDPRDGKQDNWYYGTGEIRGSSADGNGGAFYRGDGIYTSTDGGDAWSVIPETSTGDITTTDNVFRYVNNLAIDASNTLEDELYAAVIDGIIRTTDGFQTWEFVLGDPANVSLTTDVAITSTGRVYATVSDDGTDPNQDIGIWYSDNGVDWTEIALPAGVPTSGFQKTAIGISPSDESIVYFFRTEESGEEFNLFVYDADLDELTVRPTSALPSDLDTQSSYDQYVRVHPTNSDVVFLGGVDLYRSTNGFVDNSATMQIGGSDLGPSRGILYINHHVDQHAMIFYPSNPNKVITANDGGLAITNDIMKATTTLDSFVDPFFGEPVSDSVTVEWEELNDGYITSQFHAVAISEDTKGFPWISGGLQDNSTQISTLNDPNDFWGELFGGDGAFTALTYNSLIASAQYAQLVRFSIIDDGSETDIAYPPNGGDTDSALFIAPFLSDPVLPNKVFVSGRGVLYSTYDITQNPNDDDWFELGRDELNDDEFVTALSASVADNDQLIFSTFDLGTGFSKVWRIPNTNEPVPITEITGTNLPDGWISSIQVDPRDGDKITIVYSNYDIISVYHTNDGGTSWTPVAGNLEENEDGTGNGPSVRWVEVMPNGAGNIYLLGTSTGLYYTESFNGVSTVWSQAGATTIGNAVIDMLAVRPVDGYVVVSTHGKGVYQATLDVPLQPRIFLDGFPCQGEPFTIFANQEFESSELTYEWLIDGEVLTGLTGPGISGESLDTRFTAQARVTNTTTGVTTLSNLLDVQPRNNVFCESTKVLGVSQDRLSSVQIYPNPVGERLNVSGIEPGTPYQIFDNMGRRLLDGTYDNSISVSSLEQGPYLLVLRQGNLRTTRRFVKK